MLGSLEDIEFIDKEKYLGQGGFAKVHRVRHKKNNQIYALKIIELIGLKRAELMALKNEV